MPMQSFLLRRASYVRTSKGTFKVCEDRQMNLIMDGTGQTLSSMTIHDANHELNYWLITKCRPLHHPIPAYINVILENAVGPSSSLSEGLFIFPLLLPSLASAL